jgi:hypothetical protein
MWLSTERGMNLRRGLQGLFVLAGIALIIAGANGNRPLVIVGSSLIVLALVGRMSGRANKQ